jgi:hypothetical protein
LHILRRREQNEQVDRWYVCGGARTALYFCFRSRLQPVAAPPSNCLTCWIYSNPTLLLLYILLSLWSLVLYFFRYRCIGWIFFYFKTFLLRMTVDSWRDRNRQLLSRCVCGRQLSSFVFFRYKFFSLFIVGERTSISSSSFHENKSTHTTLWFVMD